MTCTHAATEVADACMTDCPICQRAEIERLTAENERLRALLREMPVKHPQQAARRDELLAAFQQKAVNSEEGK